MEMLKVESEECSRGIFPQVVVLPKNNPRSTADNTVHNALRRTQRFKYFAARIDCRLRLVTWQVACGRCGRCGRWQLWQEAH